MTSVVSSFSLSPCSSSACSKTVAGANSGAAETFHVAPVAWPPRPALLRALAEQSTQMEIARMFGVSRGKVQRMYRAHGIEAQCHRRFTEEDYLEIAERKAAGETARDLAIAYNTTRSVIYNACQRVAEEMGDPEGEASGLRGLLPRPLTEQEIADLYAGRRYQDVGAGR